MPCFALAARVLKECFVRYWVFILFRILNVAILIFVGYEVFNLILHVILFLLLFNLFIFLRFEDVVDQLGLSFR